MPKTPTINALNPFIPMANPIGANSILEIKSATIPKALLIKNLKITFNGFIKIIMIMKATQINIIYKIT